MCINHLDDRKTENMRMKVASERERGKKRKHSVAFNYFIFHMNQLMDDILNNWQQQQKSSGKIPNSNYIVPNLCIALNCNLDSMKAFTVVRLMHLTAAMTILKNFNAQTHGIAHYHWGTRELHRFERPNETMMEVSYQADLLHMQRNCILTNSNNLFGLRLLARSLTKQIICRKS